MDQSNIHLLRIPNRTAFMKKAEWLQEHGYYTSMSIIELTDMLIEMEKAKDKEKKE
jgi:hypothetical protein